VPRGPSGMAFCTLSNTSATWSRAFRTLNPIALAAAATQQGIWLYVMNECARFQVQAAALLGVMAFDVCMCQARARIALACYC
jgi:hypothetical protein